MLLANAQRSKNQSVRVGVCQSESVHLCISVSLAPHATVNTILLSSKSVQEHSQVSDSSEREQVIITPEWVNGYTQGFHLASGLFQVGQQSGRCEGTESNLSLSAQVEVLKQQLQEKEYSLTLYKNAKQVDTEINADLRRELDQCHENIQHLSESYIDTIARNSFLEDRNRAYYLNYHNLSEELNTTGSLTDSAEKPPSQGPL